jgi:radical SAM superfamily enzyme YgiQ (UPF0313 family)
MIGLPTETAADLDGIADLVERIRQVYYGTPKERRGGRLSITVSASCFVPKACTPFQWEAQDDIDTLREKQYYLKDRLKMKAVRFNYHDAKTSFLEAVFARGDRRLGAALVHACRGGAMFDAWQEHFSLSRYMDAFAACGIDPRFYTRARDREEILPYAQIDCLIDARYLLRESDKARRGETTPPCGGACAACGLQGVCAPREGGSR